MLALTAMYVSGILPGADAFCRAIIGGDVCRWIGVFDPFSQHFLDLREDDDNNILCLKDRTDVSVVVGSYYLDGTTETTMFSEGVYRFDNIPKSHPMALLGGDGCVISNIVCEFECTDCSSDAKYCHGTASWRVSKKCDALSLRCGYHGWMGGNERLRYDASCPIPLPSPPPQHSPPPPRRPPPRSPPPDQPGVSPPSESYSYDAEFNAPPIPPGAAGSLCENTCSVLDPHAETYIDDGVCDTDVCEYGHDCADCGSVHCVQDVDAAILEKRCTKDSLNITDCSVTVGNLGSRSAYWFQDYGMSVSYVFNEDDGTVTGLVETDTPGVTLYREEKGHFGLLSTYTFGAHTNNTWHLRIHPVPFSASPYNVSLYLMPVLECNPSNNYLVLASYP